MMNSTTSRGGSLAGFGAAGSRHAARQATVSASRRCIGDISARPRAMRCRSAPQREQQVDERGSGGGRLLIDVDGGLVTGRLHLALRLGAQPLDLGALRLFEAALHHEVDDRGELADIEECAVLL